MGRSEPTCFDCGSKANHFHHVVPKVYGGTRTLALCHDCHSKVHGIALSTPELVKAGIRKARERGVRIGRRPVVDKRKLKRIVELREQGFSFEAIGRLLKIGRETARVYWSKRDVQD